MNEELLLGGEVDNRIAVSGPPLLLEPQQAMNVGLILHELATNARKYGALATPEGQLQVTWTVNQNGDRSLGLTWVEKSAPSAIKPLSSGFGTSLIQQLVTPDGGSAHLCHTADGIRWDIRLVLRSGKSFADDPKQVDQSFGGYLKLARGERDTLQ